MFKRPNVFLEVKSYPGMDFQDCLQWYFNLLKEKGQATDKAVIYVK